METFLLALLAKSADMLSLPAFRYYGDEVSISLFLHSWEILSSVRWHCLVNAVWRSARYRVAAPEKEGVPFSRSSQGQSVAGLGVVH